MACPDASSADSSATAALLARAKRLTVKVGSALMLASGSGKARAEWLATVAEDLRDLRGRGTEIVVVSSGAVALGRECLGAGAGTRLAMKQAAAAAGQPRLMAAWDEALAPYGIPTAQLLLTLDDSESRRRWLNARATLEALLASGALPVVNENDSVATEELRCGDNDRLSARVAQMARSDVLLLLSDVDGLYTSDPNGDPAARHVPFVERVTSDVYSFAGTATRGGVGTGGMRTKLDAAQIAQGFGCATIIARGTGEHPIRAIENGARATVVAAAGTPARAYKQWIAGTLSPAGSLTVDDGAARALRTGGSLLPAGVTAVEGSFERGVCLRILDSAGREIARGLTAYASLEAETIRGCGRGQVPGRLGWQGPDEIVHRDDLVLL